MKLLKWIADAYGMLFLAIQRIVSFIWEGGEASKQAMVVISALLGILGFELIYFNQAENVCTGQVIPDTFFREFS